MTPLHKYKDYNTSQKHLTVVGVLLESWAVAVAGTVAGRMVGVERTGAELVGRADGYLCMGMSVYLCTICKIYICKTISKLILS